MKALYLHEIMVMENLLKNMLLLLSRGEKAALSSVISRSGSVPAPANSKLLVDSAGKIWGTVGGGALEGEVHHQAREVIAAERPSIKSFDFQSDSLESALQICGGKITLYTEVIFPTAQEIAIYSTALEAIRASRTAALVTAVQTAYSERPPSGPRVLLGREGVLAGSLARPEWNRKLSEKAKEMFGQEDPLYLELAEKPAGCQHLAGFLIELIHPAPALVIFGGGHIGVPLCRLGALCGFRVTVVDDRAEYADPARFPEAERTLHSDFEKVFDSLEIGPRHYLVSVTRCHTTDRQVIGRAAGLPAAYIGMIGSRRKVKLLWEELERRGVERVALERVHAPVGVEIGAETPEEIAVSILAQIIQTRRDKKPGINQGSIRL